MRAFVFVVMLLHSLILRTKQKLSRSILVLNDDSVNTHDECLKRVLLQSFAQHVRLVCGSNATLCPSTIVKETVGMSWMLSNRNSTVGMYDRRHFCVMAGHNISHLHDVFLSNPDCSKEKNVLVVPSGPSSESHSLEKVFLAAWEVGIIDIAVVVSDSLCRVHTYVPIREHGRQQCPDLTPVLISSWAKDSEASIIESSVTFFPPNKISSLHLCEIQVVVKSDVRHFLSPALGFLEKAMNATFNISVIPYHPNLFNKLRPSEIQVTPVLVHEILSVKCVLPSYLRFEENIFAVPRVPPSSLQWFRLFSELSACVWYGLITTTLVMTGLLYFLNSGDRDFAFVVLFVLQPLLVTPRQGNFLCCHGKVVFIMWLLFCFILQSSYLCTFLSELTVPSTADTLKSLDDLLKTALPIHVGLHLDAETLPFDPLQSKALLSKIHAHDTGNFYTMVQKNRYDIAYIVPRYMFNALFFKMPYRILPGTSINTALMPFRLNKPSPYERFFEIAFMRALGAGAIDKLFIDFRLDHFLEIRKEGGPSMEEVVKPLSLSTIGVLIAVWLLGCVLAIICFIAEIFSRCTFAIHSVSVSISTPRAAYFRSHQ